MGCSQICVCFHRNTHITIPLVLLLVSSLTHARFTAAGRALSKQENTSHEEEEKAVVTSQIGSRPPRCERKCSTCGHCEAVQVPVVPLLHHFSASAYSRGQDISNYKPMSWKCKCGNLIFNP